MTGTVLIALPSLAGRPSSVRASVMPAETAAMSPGALRSAVTRPISRAAMMRLASSGEVSRVIVV